MAKKRASILFAQPAAARQRESPQAVDSESMRFVVWRSSSAGKYCAYCLMRKIPVTTALSFFPAELANALIVSSVRFTEMGPA